MSRDVALIARVLHGRVRFPRARPPHQLPCALSCSLLDQCELALATSHLSPPHHLLHHQHTIPITSDRNTPDRIPPPPAAISPAAIAADSSCQHVIVSVHRQTNSRHNLTHLHSSHTMAAPHTTGGSPSPDTLITIKISVNDQLKKLKLPLRDLGAHTLPRKVCEAYATLVAWLPETHTTLIAQEATNTSRGPSSIHH